MKFDELKLAAPLLRAVSGEGYTAPTPIQEGAIPHALAGKDVLGVAQTGTGKTAAFVLPTLQRLSAAPAPARRIRCLVLTPTRELATQVGDSFATYGRFLPFRHTVVFGGVGQNPQVQAIRGGVEIVVATPGRLLDLINQKLVSLAHVEVFVLDEADRMLDMGFLPDVRRIIGALPKQHRQTLFFSATMPPEITQLSSTILSHPVRVEVTPVSSTADTVEQRLYLVDNEDKRELLAHLLQKPEISRALVFTRTKHGADRVVKDLAKANIEAQAIHGNKSQNARERALNGFRDGGLRVLVATDIAARGIDVDGISHVINFDLPNIPEQYVHRIGRTGRAGAAGIALSFCDAEERSYLRDIERTIRRSVPVIQAQPFHSVRAQNASPNTPPPKQGQRGGRGQGKGRPQQHGGGAKRAPAKGGGASTAPSKSAPKSFSTSRSRPPRRQTAKWS
jgi:ATP-dependent RNA helicase RhlE